ncbi:18044_t:CDS:2 [Acaulospora morrowiae]|uniref:18044_t:CDS:1 n=1 Tax=Acaulospora morrowiae TaxID=94023 RepID=A0A9N9GD78_9GLOM|nr:18044_t:CDS:2 [Acaulospora morrowiae]
MIWPGLALFYCSSMDWISSIVLLLVFYIIQFYFKYFTRSNKLPGPIPLPIVGNSLQYHGNPAIWVSKLQEKYGDICELYMGTERQILLSNGDLVSKIVSPQTNNNFLIRITARQGLDEIDVTTKGITFNRNLESWSYNRKFFNQAISSPKFLKQTVEKTQELFFEMVNYWSNLGQDADLNFSEWMSQFTMDLVFLMTTNRRAYTFANYYNIISENKVEISEGVLKEAGTFIRNIQSWLCALQFFMDTPKLWRDCIPGLRKKADAMKSDIDTVNQAFLDLIRDRKREIERTPLDEPLRADILTMLLTVNTPRDITTNIADDEHTRPMTDEEVRGNLLEAIAAGVDTTANTFCFIVYHLAHHPKVKELMIKEFDSVFGDRPNRLILYEDLNKLEYCEAIIKEVSRIMSIVPVIFRMAIRSDEISGHHFSGSTQFLLNSFAIHNHKSHWQNPEEFDPSRFMRDESNSKSKVHNNSLLIFGGGLRMCPGKKFAMTLIKTLMVSVYRKYDVELTNMDAPLKYHYSVVKHCDDLNVRTMTKYSGSSSRSSGGGSHGSRPHSGSVSSAKTSANTRANAYNPGARSYNPTVKGNTGGRSAMRSHKTAAKNNEIIRDTGEW